MEMGAQWFSSMPSEKGTMLQEDLHNVNKVP